MFAKNLYRMFCALLALAFLGGCRSAPMAEAIRPTDGVVSQATAAESILQSTATPVETEFVAGNLEDIAGMWSSCCHRGDTLFFLFNPDGTIEIGQQNDLPAIKNGNHPSYTFSFDGNVFHIRDVQGPNSICGEAEGTYRLTVYQADGQNSELSFEVLEDECTDRRAEFGKRMYWVDS